MPSSEQTAHQPICKRPFTALIALAFGLTACGVTIDNGPRNQSLVAGFAAQDMDKIGSSLPATNQPLPEVSVAMAFSGGGARAAAFALGALQGLSSLPAPTPFDGTLLDHLGFITSVSGGSMTAAWVGLYGTGSLDEFRHKALLRDSEQGLRASLLNPTNLLRLAAGGLNDRNNFQHWLDNEVFHQATFAEMSRPGHPLVWINATDLQQRMPFTFHQGVFSTLCSDLSTYPVAEAVAASMAVPLVFAPIVLEKHTEHCPVDLGVDSSTKSKALSSTMLGQAIAGAMRDLRDAHSGRYVKLVDGGLTDNFGLTSVQQFRTLAGTTYAPLSRAEALHLRRLLFVVVDGGRRPSVAWNRVVEGPDGIDMASASIDAAIDTNVRLSYDGFLRMIQQWQRDVVQLRCALPHEEQLLLKTGRPHWRCDDVELSVTRISFDDLAPSRAAMLHEVSTRLTLPASQVDAVTAAGRDAAIGNAAIRAFSSQSLLRH
ncbi:NTE family protein [Sphaerotilus hippei]|uniref:NTE family protein n=1 Tax=Sphaerotilus hippei TaxID=744406 RepID=A0A318GYI5_9BURK|nr:patatin-like phospholipase family protein [Sphaerotilus hippei]PXW91980.1 NTE family protein [Sphaerotilus hippei]